MDLYAKSDFEILEAVLGQKKYREIGKEIGEKEEKNKVAYVEENELIFVKEPQPYGNPFRVFKKLFNQNDKVSYTEDNSESLQDFQ